MAMKKNGIYAPTREYGKHPRPWGKRQFWKHERQVVRLAARREALHDRA
jgi:hypothetical protein